MRGVLSVVLAGVIGTGVQLMVAQTPAPPVSDGTTLTARSTLVLVPALVRTKGGQLVHTLTASDFVLTDDGVPQKLRLEEDTGGEPLALVVAIEVGGAGTREFDKLQSLAPMIESVVGAVPHRIAVVAFDSHATLERDFTSNVDTAAAAISGLIPSCTQQRWQDNCAVPEADNGAAILDSIGFSVELLRAQPTEYRRAILLVSETLDRGSKMTVGDAVRAVSDTNTAIYSIGFSTGKSEAGHYGARELGGSRPNPPNGCMGKDPDPDPDATQNKAVQAYDCLTQLAPPLALAKMAAIAALDGLKRNVPEAVARLTGGEYFKLTDSKSLERDLSTISNHIPNRYILSFQPQSPHPGLHAIGLRVPDYEHLEVTARSSYWADDGETAAPAAKPVP